MQILIMESTSGIYRWDRILFLYFIVVGIALGDIVGCFANDMALIDCAEKGDDSE